MPKIHTFPNEENILKQIKEEYKEGFEHVRSKREIKQKELKDYERIWNRELLLRKRISGGL